MDLGIVLGLFFGQYERAGHQIGECLFQPPLAFQIGDGHGTTPFLFPDILIGEALETGQ